MLDLLFPDLCPSCGSKPADGDTICNKCEESIDLLDELSTCVLCGAPFGYFDSRSSLRKELPEEGADSHLCSKCLKGRFSFERARSIAIYTGPIREMIHAFKYEGKLNLAQFLSYTMIEHMPYQEGSFDVVVPVPLYIDKLRAREYNQSAVLAANFAGQRRVPVNLSGLVKIRDTLPQIGIKDEASRRRNVKGAFQVRPENPFEGRSVLLIDDVFTTGSTSDECTKTLLKSGALSVRVLTLARARGI